MAVKHDGSCFDVGIVTHRRLMQFFSMLSSESRGNSVRLMCGCNRELMDSVFASLLGVASPNF